MMTYEAYMKKSLVELRKLASAMGVKDVYSYRKAALVEEMLKCPEHLESLPEQIAAEAPKRRGRPPKEKKDDQTEQALAEKKRRGRPPKAQAAHETEPTEAQAAKAEDKAAGRVTRKATALASNGRISVPARCATKALMSRWIAPFRKCWIPETADNARVFWKFCRMAMALSGRWSDVWPAGCICFHCTDPKIYLATGDQIKGRTRPAGPTEISAGAAVYRPYQ